MGREKFNLVKKQPIKHLLVQSQQWKHSKKV